MAECGGLENRYTERYRGFESYPLRILVFLLGMLSTCPVFAAEIPKQASSSPAAPVSGPASKETEGERQSLLENIHSILVDLSPAEIEKISGLRQVSENGQSKWYLNGRLLESLDIKVLDILNGRLDQAMKQHSLDEIHETEERRKAVQDMMESRRLAEENNQRWKR